MTNNIQELGFKKTNQDNEKNESSLMSAQSARAVAEVQASYVIAKKYPRDQHKAYSNVITMCQRPFLAEQSMYAYPRGGQLVEGPSIRLAEALGQAWGNIECGVKELSQANRISVAEAYAIDLETNTRVTKIFHVPHHRDTRKGRKTLTDSRDIYELVANQGARRLRACILAVIPGDVIEAAVAQCRKTLESSDIPVQDQVRKMITAFDSYGVKTAHIEKFLGHNLDAIIPAEIVKLKSVYKSIKDGMGKREDFFDITSAIDSSAKENLDQMLSGKSSTKTKKEDVSNVDVSNFKAAESEIIVDKEVFIADVQTLEKIVVDKKISGNIIQQWMEESNATSFSELKHKTVKALIKKYGN